MFRNPTDIDGLVQKYSLYPTLVFVIIYVIHVSCHNKLSQCKKIRKNIYRSDVQITFEFYGNFLMFTGPSLQMKLHLSTVLLIGFQSSPGSFEIH